MTTLSAFRLRSVVPSVRRRVAVGAVVIATLLGAGPALAELAGADPGVRVPGFWDPRRRPERPDLSRSA